MKTRVFTLAFIGLLTLAGCGSKWRQKAESLQTLQAEDSPVKEQVEGWMLIRRLPKAYGLSGDWMDDPGCPAFLMGAYLFKFRKFNLQLLIYKCRKYVSYLPPC